ncbi:hypothetical protein HDU76_010694 [Blyttiomyces sp. JEL0837]|nr:hypothetical protein HDU76_010694 [Blyttiomyces sp. JEL0837]
MDSFMMGSSAIPPTPRRRGTAHNINTVGSTSSGGSNYGGMPITPSRQFSDTSLPMMTQPPPPPPPTSSSEMGVGMPVRAPNQGPAAPVSLFATCMSLIETLYSFPLFEFYLFPDGWEIYNQPDAPLLDPVAILWGTFKLGAPLCMIYNQLSPRTPLNVSDVSAIRPGDYKKVCKDNVYHFILACRNELQLSEANDFSISELYKDDTHGFMKILKLVQVIIAKIESNGLLPPKRKFPLDIPTSSADAPQDNRSKLIKELIDTERAYIHALEQLQTYQKEVVLQKLLSKEQVYGVFSNLSDLLDFQRRFMVAMEATLTFSPNEQRIGLLFIQNEDAFSVYHPFCANYQYATTLVLEEMENLRKIAHIIEPIQLQSYLIKPIQRVCKYPLLINELIKLTDKDKYPYMDELREGHEAIKRITEKVNEESRRAENESLKNDLADRVEDWKGLNIRDFGDLMLSEKFLMSSNDQEREYNLFLFEKILLCCKDLQKPRKKKRGETGKDTGTTYSLKGNIYINAISSVEDISDASIGYFAFKVYWKDITEWVCFSLKCRNPEQVKLWKGRIERLIGAQQEKRKPSIDAGVQLGSAYSARPPPPPAGYPGRSSSRDEDAMRDSGYGPSINSAYPGQSLQQTLPGNPPGRSRSIPNNYYANGQQPFSPAVSAPPMPLPLPQQQQQQQPGQQVAPGQRRSQLAMERGYGSASDANVRQPPYGNQSPGSQSFSGVPRPPSASPTPGMYPPRTDSPPPPVPPIPQLANMSMGGSNSPSSGQFQNIRPHNRNGSDTSIVNMTRQPSRGENMRSGSGQGGVNLPPNPPRSFSIDPTSASQAAIAAAATGGVPLAGYSDDDYSDDDEYYPPQNRQQQNLPPRLGSNASSSSPMSQSMHARKMSQESGLKSAQRRSGGAPPDFNPAMVNGGMGGLQRTNTFSGPRMQREPSQDDGSRISPSTPNPFSPSSSSPWSVGPPNAPVPPVPSIPANYQQSSQQQQQPSQYHRRSPSGDFGQQQQQIQQLQQQSANFHRRSPSIGDSAMRYNGPPSSTAPYPQSPLTPTNPNLPPGMRPGPPQRQFNIPPPPSQPLPPPPTSTYSNGELMSPSSNVPPAMRRAPTAPLPQPPGTTSTDPLPPPMPATLNLASSGFIKVKTHYEADVFVIAIPSRGASYAELVTRIERKIKLCGGRSPGELGRVMRMKYRRPDVANEEWIEVLSDEDVAVAFDLARNAKERGVLNLFVS